MARRKARKSSKPSGPPEPDLFSGLEPPPEAPSADNNHDSSKTKADEHPVAFDSQAGIEGVQARIPKGMVLAEVAVEGSLRTTFTYLAKEDLASQLVPGSRVEVPFGHRKTQGYFLGEKTAEDLFKDRLDPSRLKAIIRRLDDASGANRAETDRSLLTPELMRLAEWIAQRYACSLGLVLASMLPAGVKKGASAGRERLVNYVKTDDELRELADSIQKKAPKQAAVLRTLLSEGEPMPATELLSRSGASAATLKSLEGKGWVSVTQKAPVSLGDSYGPDSNAQTELKLTTHQEEALNAICAPLREGRHAAFLLQGVTSSGKTEVYLRALQQTLSLGKQGIVLVPEIALTPQTAQRFEGRLGRDRVTVLHSHLTGGERAEAWRQVRAGKIDVVVGARSALFAPLKDLGCIIMDEEHESAFKQETSPRYHARPVAAERARMNNAVLIAGSATPSLETCHAARTGQYTHLVLPERVGHGELPPIDVIDMRAENQETKRYNYLSRPLKHAMRQVLDRREQAILFLNRRGYATVITCNRCGHTERCERCDITLTSRKEREVLICNYCGLEKPIPVNCSACQVPGIKFWGVGTERVEGEVRASFPEARIARMDSDTMTRRTSYVDTLSAFRSGDIDILVGTQMIAKGLDFPNVTLVGIVLADTALHMPDFRSRERTYQLIEQVAGRAGRGEKGGRVIVQTHLPDDQAIRFAANYDYQGFQYSELPERKKFEYPPFTHLARVLIRGKNEAKVSEAAKQAGEILKEGLKDTQIRMLGPAQAPISMLEGWHRYHLLIKAPDHDQLGRLFNEETWQTLNKLKGAEVQIDIDPLSML